VFAQVQGFLFQSFFFFGVKKPPGVPGVCFCGSVYCSSFAIMFFWFSSGSDLKISNKPTSSDVACFLPHIVWPSSSFVSLMFWRMF